MPRIPEVKAALALGDGALGAALLGTGAGALVGSLVAAPLLARHGSRGVAAGAALGLCAALVLPGVAPSWAALLAALCVVGALDATTDVAMNAHGVAVEGTLGRRVMSGFHGLWSLGAVVGAVAGSAAAGAGVPVPVHLVGVGAVLAAVVVGTRWLLLPAAVDRRGSRQPGVALPGRALALLAGLAVAVSLAEGVPGDWSAVYLVDDLGVGAGGAGSAFAAFMATMLVGRLVGDRVLTRHGHVATTRVGGALAAAGFAVALVSGDAVGAALGFALAGLGLSTVFPTLFSAAGSVPGTTAGTGIAAVSLVARVGFLAGPPLIGALAAAAGLPTALWLAVAACAAVAVAASAVAPADGRRLDA